MDALKLIYNGISPALALLPSVMDTPIARRIMLAIAYQESNLEHRRQIRGPARGYYQFEIGGGVRGVLEHHATSGYAAEALKAMDFGHYVGDAEGCAIAIEHNDIVASIFARLLLWSDPHPLPTNQGGAWDMYLRTWRPGKPHIRKWAENWARAAG